MQLDLQLLNKLVELDYVRGVHHKELPLIVWNYTRFCQYDKAWGDYPILRKCRGLVADLEGNVVLSPYPKFFNYHEMQQSELPIGAKNFVIETKYDGSLLIAGKSHGQSIFCTRGSFYSDQSVLGQKLFHELYDESWLEDGLTYNFEVIGPSNRIVNRYVSDDLILLGVLETSTGLDAETSYPFKKGEKHEVSGHFFGPELAKYLQDFNTENEEGFVIKVKEPGIPTWICKVKFKDYCVKHSIMSHMSSIVVYEHLRDEIPFDDILDIFPDEFDAWVYKTRQELLDQFTAIEDSAKESLEMVKHLPTRKEQAVEVIKNHKKHFDIIFLMLDGKSYDEAIWKKLRPVYSVPFVMED